MIGKFNQGQSIVTGKHDHCFAYQLSVAFDLHRQRYIEKVLFKVCWQALGLGQ